MELCEIRPGLRYWKAPHPQWHGARDWPEHVTCVYYEAPDALALIDPLLPRDHEESFFTFFDRELERLDRPVAVLLAAPWHQRNAASLAQRYDTIVWVHPDAQARLPFETQSGALPGGIETFSPGGVREGEVAFYIRPHRALVVAELFIGTEDGLRVCVSPALQARAEFETSLQRLHTWPIDHVLVSHGDLVIDEGNRRIDDALAGFAEGR